MQAARGRLIGWLDADLDIDAGRRRGPGRGSSRSEPIDAAIGSKRHVDSRVALPARPPRVLLGLPAARAGSCSASTCATRRSARRSSGARCSRRCAPLLLVKRYAFDLEVLAVGAEFGFDRIVESPVTLEYRFSGTGINWDAVQRMFLDTLAIAYRIHCATGTFAASQRSSASGWTPPKQDATGKRPSRHRRGPRRRVRASGAVRRARIPDSAPRR